MFVIAIIAGIIGLIVLIASFPMRSIIAGLVGGVLVVIGIVFTILSSNFQIDPGQSAVVKDWSGQISGEPVSTTGWHGKTPWSDVIVFDVRNQRVVYVGGSGSNSEGDNSGNVADGPQITVQDKDGVTDNIDIAIRYSIDPAAIKDIYNQYGTEDNLKTRLIYNDIRSVVRSVPGSYTTLQLLTQRDDVQAAILKKLTEKWADDGILVEDVALQEVRPPDSVRDAFAAAQNAQIAVSTAQNKLEETKVSAQQKVVQAQAEADANAILNASLTGAILQQRYLDTLKELAAAGNLVVVPEGFNGLVNVSQ